MLDGQHGGRERGRILHPGHQGMQQAAQNVLVRLVLIHLLLRRHRYLGERTGIFDTGGGRTKLIDERTERGAQPREVLDVRAPVLIALDPGARSRDNPAGNVRRIPELDSVIITTG